ncbi:hypothetical protein LDJ79_14595 [Vibrio tritonius]|uniref:Uncharacterized protein n=4 Tax=Vibrio TaxID=662 RepID=A0ABS7YNV3_9VIBR|nr:hypothetical protein [Vibrio tritonius]MCA2017350.1 hypothetical protein [Vibrio tritonius]
MNVKNKVTRHSERVKNSHRLISLVTSNKKKNLLRGINTHENISTKLKDNIRTGNSIRDDLLIGGIIHSYGDVNNDSFLKRSSTEIFTMTSVKPLSWENEVAYTIGYINSFKNEVLDVVDIIFSFSIYQPDKVEKILSNMLEVSKKYGASNFLSYKLAFIRIANELSAKELTIATSIEDEFHHQNAEGLHYSALENLDNRISLFNIARKKISALKSKMNGNFRKALSLSNIIPTPVSENDISPFLLRATESSLIDTVHAIIIILNLSAEFKEVSSFIFKYLDGDIYTRIQEEINKLTIRSENWSPKKNYEEQEGDDYESLDIYRFCSAFLEVPKCTSYRNRLDKVIGMRLLSELDVNSPSIDFQIKKDALLVEDDIASNEDIDIPFDSFYRTYLFLIFILNKNNLLTLSGNDIKFIFENTVGLEVLLTEREMKSIELTAPKESKNLINVLTLALFRQKSTDPDIDFEFRSKFIDYVKDIYDGSIVKFIEKLLSDSPEIANYIVTVLDEVTLEKMYSLVSNSTEASDIRRNILRMLGKRLNRIEYFIEADSITTRIEVSKLQQYFDSSRMYVDSVAMKNWLDTNPSVSTEQFRTLNSRIEARSSSGDNSSFTLIYDKSEYLISQIAKEAFEEFCTNKEFGIESYLGRRIRHNTLDGVTTDTVDAIVRKPEHSYILSNQQTRKSFDTWMHHYKAIIDKLKKEHLQFKNGNSLFKSTIDIKDDFTKDNIKKLSNSIKSTGGHELLNDLLISYCWLQISPQLENAARFIKVTCLKEAYSKLDKCFTNTMSTEETALKTELKDAVNEVFGKVSDWFQVPQTGFISASIRELCNIILLDISNNLDGGKMQFSGDALDIKYTGISVHRLYDCLAVTIQNAIKHGDSNAPIIVNVSRTRQQNSTIFDLVNITVTSVVHKTKYRNAKHRIETAIDTQAKGTDMVTEGYSGIKKIKFITELSEGKHTVRLESNDEDNELSLSFSLHAENSFEEEK